MKINWNIQQDNRISVSSAMFAEMDKMKQLIEETGEIGVSVKHRTKTTLDIELGCGDQWFGVAYVPSGCEHLKFYYHSYYNYFYSEQRENYYFKLTKKQRLPELKYYLERVIENLKLERPEVTVNMIIRNVEELKDN